MRLGAFLETSKYSQLEMVLDAYSCICLHTEGPEDDVAASSVTQAVNGCMVVPARERASQNRSGVCLPTEKLRLTNTRKSKGGLDEGLVKGMTYRAVICVPDLEGDGYGLRSDDLDLRTITGYGNEGGYLRNFWSIFSGGSDEIFY
jgi:hypothetical protein